MERKNIVIAIYEKVYGKPADMRTIVRYKPRMDFINELRRVFRNYRLRDDEKLKRIEDFINYVMEEEFVRQSMMQEISEIAYEISAIPPPHKGHEYEYNEELFKFMIPSEKWNSEARYREQYAYDYLFLKLHGILIQKYRYFPNYITLKKTKTISGLMEIFYRKGKF